MPQFFSNKRLIILLVSIILLVALIGISTRDRNKITWPEQFVKDTVGWVESIFYQPAQYVAGFFQNVEEMNKVYDENKMLKAKLDEYAEMSVKVSELTKENNELKEMVGSKDNLRDYKVRQAIVVARSPEKWHQLVTVNSGAQDGVKKDMAVMTPKGLIGKVKDVSQFSSTVQLISDTGRNNRISALVEGNERVFGLVEGYDPDKKALLLKKIPKDAEVKKGQIVSTSGLGEIFPRGLVIGTVTKVVPDEYGLTQTALVKPAANFYDLDHVMIVERKALTVDNESGNKGGTK